MGIEYWCVVGERGREVGHKCSSFDELVLLDNYNDIIYIDCNYNHFKCLPKLPNSLEVLHCKYNKLTLLPELPNSLRHLDWSHQGQYFKLEIFACIFCAKLWPVNVNI